MISFQVILDGCYRLETEAIEEMCLKSPNITVLKLDECYSINDACLKSVVVIYYFSCYLVTIINFPVSWLVHCILSVCYHCADHILPALHPQVYLLFCQVHMQLPPPIFAKSYSLNNKASLHHQSVAMQHACHVIIAGLMNISHLSTLRDVRLDYQHHCDDSVIEALIDGLPSLTAISVAGCGRLTGDGIKLLGTWNCLAQVSLYSFQCSILNIREKWSSHCHTT